LLVFKQFIIYLAGSIYPEQAVAIQYPPASGSSTLI
jgi:hypothetical protein